MAEKEKKKQSPAVVALLVVIIAVATGFIIKNLLPKRYKAPDVNWSCGACEAEFVAQAATSPMVCTTCGKREAVHVIYYNCLKCDKLFEAYRMKMTPEGLAEMDRMKEMEKEGKLEEMEMMPPMPEVTMSLYKKPGGQWINDMEFEWELTCPNCGNKDRKQMKYTVKK